MRVFSHLLIQGLANFGRNKWAQFFTMTAVTFVAFLAATFLLLLYNLNQTVMATQDRLQYQVYWEKGSDLDEVREQWQEISSWEIESIKTFTPEQALQVLVDSMTGDFDPGHLARANPLPPTAIIEFSLYGKEGQDWARDVLYRLQQLPGVQRVSYNPLQMDMARTWLNITSRIFWPLIGLMLVITGLVVANTLKLNQINRRDEVEILSLVGASSGYIQFPLLITGALQGLAGGVFSIVLLKVLHMAVRDVLYFPPIWIRIDFLPPVYFGTFIFSLACVGVMSSLIAGKERGRSA